MAEEWVRAVELLKNTEHRKWLEHAYVEYVPDDGEMIFPDDKTGQDNYNSLCRNGRFMSFVDGRLIDGPRPKAKTEQEARTEHNNIGCHLTLGPEKKLMVVSREVTEFKLFLYGLKGAQNALELFQQYAEKCFRNSKLKAEPMCLNRVLVNGLSKWLKETPERPYWLADEEEIPENVYDPYSSKSYLLFIMQENGKVRETPMKSYIRGMSDGEGNFSVRFAAYLPPETVVNIGNRIWDGSTPIRPLQMKLGKPSDDSKLKVPKMNLNGENIEGYIEELKSWRKGMEEKIKEIDSHIARLEKLRKG